MKTKNQTVEKAHYITAVSVSVFKGEASGFKKNFKKADEQSLFKEACGADLRYIP
jgi:hypothetical protein